MNKDKEWFKKQHRDAWSDFYSNLEGMGKLRDRIEDSIDQLKEPETVIVPQFIADEFDYNKNPYWEVDEARMVAHILRCSFGDEAKPSEFLDWVRENPEDYVMAVRNGYEVEKEKLYYVLSNQGETLLMLIGGKVCLSGGYEPHDSNKHIYQLTKKQIKDYDERFWSFVKEVTE